MKKKINLKFEINMRPRSISGSL